MHTAEADNCGVCTSIYLSDIMHTIRIRLLLTVSDEATRHTKGSSHGLKIRLAILESTSQFWYFPPKISAVRGVTFIV